MAKRILLSILRNFMLTQSSSNKPDEIDSYYADLEKEIELYNHFTKQKIKSSPTSIQALKSEFYLNVLFFNPTENIDIEVTNDVGGLMHQRTIDNPGQNQLLVGIYDWEKGNYKIQISYRNGEKRLKGSFEV